MAYERLAGPLGADRTDLQASIVAATVANAMRSRRRPFKVTDFIPQWGGRRQREQSLEEMAAALVDINAAMGGEDRRGNDR